MSEAIEHEGEVVLIGEVRAADLDTGVFALRLEDGETVQVHFRPEQEETVTAALREHDNRRLHLRGRAELTHVGGKVKRVLTVEEARLEEPPIWETLLKISASVPKEEWSKVPQDLARHVDHYLHGARKRDE